MSSHSLLVSLIAVAVSVALVSVVVITTDSPEADVATTQTDDGQPSAAPALHVVELRRHESPRIATGATDTDGKPLTVSCSTCHTMLEPHRETTAADLDEFHQGLHFQHGSNSCLSCHNPEDYDSLRLADGRKVAFTESIELCSQCHGPQRRDFDHGAHGGMTGFWQQSQGARVRNTCLNCHDAHVPKYQAAIPVEGPRDRFQQPARGHDGAAHD
jgi:hypothetical protein